MSESRDRRNVRSDRTAPVRADHTVGSRHRASPHRSGADARLRRKKKTSATLKFPRRRQFRHQQSAVNTRPQHYSCDTYPGRKSAKSSNPLAALMGGSSSSTTTTTATTTAGGSGAAANGEQLAAIMEVLSRTTPPASSSPSVTSSKSTSTYTYNKASPSPRSPQRETRNFTRTSLTQTPTDNGVKLTFHTNTISVELPIDPESGQAMVGDEMARLLEQLSLSRASPEAYTDTLTTMPAENAFTQTSLPCSPDIDGDSQLLGTFDDFDEHHYSSDLSHDDDEDDEAAADTHSDDAVDAVGAADDSDGDGQGDEDELEAEGDGGGDPRVYRRRLSLDKKARGIKSWMKRGRRKLKKKEKRRRNNEPDRKGKAIITPSMYASKDQKKPANSDSGSGSKHKSFEVPDFPRGEPELDRIRRHRWRKNVASRRKYGGGSGSGSGGGSGSYSASGTGGASSGSGSFRSVLNSSSGHSRYRSGSELRRNVQPAPPPRPSVFADEDSADEFDSPAPVSPPMRPRGRNRRAGSVGALRNPRPAAPSLFRGGDEWSDDVDPLNRGRSSGTARSLAVNVGADREPGTIATTTVPPSAYVAGSPKAITNMPPVAIHKIRSVLSPRSAEEVSDDLSFSVAANPMAPSLPGQSPHSAFTGFDLSGRSTTSAFSLADSLSPRSDGSNP